MLDRGNIGCPLLCYDTESTLNVHHRYYKDNADPWEYPLEALVTLEIGVKA